jgi:hypothetical protein
MEKGRGLTIYFNDGSKVSFSFPQQITHDELIAGRMDKLLEKKALVVQADGALMVIPFANIKYMQLYASPPKLPDYVIKDATVDA